MTKATKIITTTIIIAAIILGVVWACTKVEVQPTKPKDTPTSQNTESNDSGSSGGGDGTGGGTGGGGTGGGGVGTDNFTYLYNYGENFVRYTPTPNKFEKVNHYNRDESRQMMPIDLHSWSIANFNPSKKIFSNFRLKDAGGVVLYEYHDTEGAVHVSFAQNEREISRGNNHQSDYSRFMIASGGYSIEYEVLGNSVGKPSLEFVEQHEGNTFRMIIGSNPDGNLIGQVNVSDRLLIESKNEIITRNFTINFINENNCILKFNANGFEN